MAFKILELNGNSDLIQLITLPRRAILGSGNHPRIGDQIMTMATTTIRIDIDTLPEHLDRSRPSVVAEVIEAALREGGIKADCSDLFSHLKIDLPTAQLAAASAVLVDLQLI
jgi:hypothetical protein